MSVIVPVHNEADVLGEQLESLTRQTYPLPWELMVVDDGSTDDSRAVIDAWRDRIPWMRVLVAPRSLGPSAARNAGAAVSEGDTLVFCDADDVVAPDWLEQLVESLREHEFVGGVRDQVTLNPSIGPGWHEASMSRLQVGLSFKPFASSCNMALSRSLFEEVGGFDESLVSSEDVDLSFRLQLAGHELYCNPHAVVAKRQRDDLRSTWNQRYVGGRADVALYKRYRHLGMRRPRPAVTLRGYLKLLVRIPQVLEPDTRLRWVARAGGRWGRLVGSVRERVLYL